MSLTPDIHTFLKTGPAKSVRLPIFGKYDCYLEITIEECHQTNCDHQNNEIVHKNLDEPPQEMLKTLADANNDINANELIPNNEIDKLNNMLTEIIHSKVKTAVESSIECNCDSPECSCSKIAAQETPKLSGSNLPRPLSSLTTSTNKSSAADSKKHRFDSKIPNMLPAKENFRRTFVNEFQDLPLEGHQQIEDDIDVLANEIYSPEEREKKLRLLRLLIQEAIPGTDRSKSPVPIMNKTIEIPNMFGNDLKRTDSLIIRIIVEK